MSWLHSRPFLYDKQALRVGIFPAKATCSSIS
jgi:hypothetical protein